MHILKGAMYRFANLERFILNVPSSSFVIRANRFHPCSFMVYYYLCEVLFSGYHQFNGNFVRG